MALFLFLFWIILNGKVTVEIVIVGAVVSAALTVFARRVLHTSSQAEVRFLRRLPGIFCYLFYLVGQVILSNLQVIRLILVPGEGRPKLVWFRAPLKEEGGRLTLANSITLTPGTVTVSLNEDTICVYALRPEMGEGLKDSGFVKRLKKWEAKDID